MLFVEKVILFIVLAQNALCRFGAQEQFYPPIADRITALCPKSTDNTGLCPTLRGDAIVPVLANAGACDQQDHADKFVDFAKQFFKQKPFRDQFIQIAKDYRTMERNTNEDGKCSPLCDRPPRNQELAGLTQAQDPGCNLQDTNSSNSSNTETTEEVPTPTNSGEDSPNDEFDTEISVEVSGEAETTVVPGEDPVDNSIDSTD